MNRFKIISKGGADRPKIVLAARIYAFLDHLHNAAVMGQIQAADNSFHMTQNLQVDPD